MNPATNLRSDSSVPGYGHGSAVASPKLAQPYCPQVFAARDFLAEQVALAKERFQDLAARLAPVLVPTPSESGCGPAPAQSAPSDLAISLFNQGREVSSLNDWIDAIISRLDI